MSVPVGAAPEDQSPEPGERAGQAAAERSDRFPAGIPFIVGNEGAERFSYYGMRAILYVYMAALYTQFVSEAQLSDAASSAAKAKATAVTHLFMAGVYAFPMIGAILADRLLGKYPVIMWVSLIYCAGHGVLALAGRFGAAGNFAGAEYGMYIGLALIAIGSGGIKPCVSANVGDQFSTKNSHLVSKVFQIFYFIINFGSFFSTLLTPLLYSRFGPEVAFGVPGIMMGLATFVFWLGRKRFVRVAPKPGGSLGALDFLSSALLFSPVVAIILAVFVQGGHFEVGDGKGMSGAQFYWDYLSRYTSFLVTTSWPYFALSAVLVAIGLLLFSLRQKKQQDNGFLAVLLYAFQHRRQRKPGDRFLEPARIKFGDEAAEGPPAVLRIILVFSMVSVFWALFDQHASTWIEQAKQMNRTLTVPFWTGRYGVAAAITLSLLGGTWLMLWVSNRTIPKGVSRFVFAAVGFAGVAAVLADLIGGHSTTIELKAAQIAALNPLMVMMIIPGLNVLVYRPLEKRGVTVKPLVKMTLGMFLSAVAFAVAALLQTRMEALVADGDRVHVLWQIAQYLVMTTAEVLVSVTGLEFAYTQAPRRMKSTIMGFWLLGVTFGNILVAFLAPMQTILTLSNFFWVFTGLMTAAAIVFSVMAYFYKGKSYLQAEAQH
jgi:proton-dependent oligopeptide transporter, POT family